MECCDIPYAGRFKLGILGAMLAFVLIVLGLVPPFNNMLVPFPILWLLAVILLIPSLAVYYDVRDKFWAEVVKKSKSKKRRSK